MDEKSLKPQLRFKGFADAWEQRKLSEIASYLPSNLSASNTDINGRFDLYDANGVIGKTNAMPQKESYITIIKDGSGVGRVRMLPPQTCYIGTMGGIFSKATNNIDFIFHTLSNFDFSTHIIGATIPHVYFSDYGNDEIGVPYETEQKMIGKFFSNLDNLITLHQRKLDKLSNVKKALLEKMFPKNDSDVPEIRFKGFTDAWEQRKLGDFGSVCMNKRIFKNQTSENDEIPFYKIGTFGGKADAFISRSLFEEYKSKYPYPVCGDILISASGSIGRTVEYQGAEEYFQDSNIVWLNHRNTIHNPFLKYFYAVVKWNGIEGSTIKRLYNENILNTQITLPQKPEQQKIGTFFSNLDNLITLHQRKLEKLKNIKKACLEKMFV